MSLQNIGPPGSNFDPSKLMNVPEASSVVMDIHKKKVEIKKSSIKDIAKGLAEVAYSLGETNDPDEFAEDMAEDILIALKQVKERQEKKKKKKKR